MTARLRRLILFTPLFLFAAIPQQPREAEKDTTAILQANYLYNIAKLVEWKDQDMRTGNFVIGVNHVLPTGGWARTGSPLTVFDFMKRTSVAYVTSKGYPELARHARVIATYEGFDGHANAVSPTRDALLKR